MFRFVTQNQLFGAQNITIRTTKQLSYKTTHLPSKRDATGSGSWLPRYVAGQQRQDRSQLQVVSGAGSGRLH